MRCEHARKIEARLPLAPAEIAGAAEHAAICDECARLPRAQEDLETEARALSARRLALPTREETSMLVRSTAPRKEIVMVKLAFLPPVPRARVLAGGAVVAAIVILLLAVPLPYSRPVGRSYELQLAAVPAQPQVAALLGGLQHGFPRAAFNVSSQDRALQVESRGAGPDAATLGAAARAAGLEPLSMRTRTLREPARGTLYAQVVQRIYHVDLGGLGDATPEHIEAEVRRQLEAQGAGDLEVHVDKQDGWTKVEAQLKSSTDTQTQVQVEGIPSGARTSTYRFDELPGATPEEKAAALQRLLAAQGVKARVEWRDGHLSVEKLP